jgi:exonuclease SbcD
VIDLKELRILHTSDWHLGVTSWTSSRPVDRREELKKALDKVVEEAEKRGVDLILLTGDLLHSRNNPSVVALHDLLDYLKRMMRTAPVVVLPGNHDWKGLKLFGNFITSISSDITFVMSFEPVDVEAKRGQKVRILPFPYPDESEALRKNEGDFRFFLESRLNKLYEEALKKEDFAIFMGHFTVEGLSGYAGIEQGREIIINRALIPSVVDYAALGHIHSFREIQKQPLTIYPGSLIKIDFGEEADEKGAVFVELKRGEPPRYERIDVVPLPLKTLYYKKIDTSALKSIRDFCRNFPGYVRVVYEEDFGILPDLMGEIDNLVKIERKSRREIEEVLRESPEEFKEELDKLDYFELFKEYLKKREENHEKLLKILDELLDEVKKSEA